ncbi:VC0807 family protein [Streptomyces erythrochromogenes]|uniref:VC0807 family protein n=1 Tax=Streptomyces erythrochromogenes TaxID=285574 RepID=UPI00382DDF16
MIILGAPCLSARSQDSYGSPTDASGTSRGNHVRTRRSDRTPAPPARKGGAAALGWILTIGLNVVAPIITYNQLRDHGWSEFAALLLSSAWPVLDSAVNLAWRRKLAEFAVVTPAFLVITAVVSLIGAHSVRDLLIKDSGVTGLFGLLCPATLLAPRPLMFHFGRKFATDGQALAGRGREAGRRGGGRSRVRGLGGLARARHDNDRWPGAQCARRATGRRYGARQQPSRRLPR